MEWINYLSQMFNRSRSRLVQDFLKNPSVLYSFLTPRICDTTGRIWLASPVSHRAHPRRHSCVLCRDEILLVRNHHQLEKRPLAKPALHVPVSLRRRCGGEC